MIFKPELIPAILDGSKTVTRRPVKHSAAGKIVPCRYVVGRDYALQTERTGKGLGPRLLVADVRGPEFVWLVSKDDDARREGFDSYLERLYGSWIPDRQVWRIEFGVVEGSAV